MKAYQIYKSTRNLSPEQWRDARRGGIGGSDASAIVGLNPWSSPLDVYVSKVGSLADKQETEAMRLGHDLEPYVAARFTEATGLRVRRENNILQSIEHPVMLANVDRMVIGQRAGLECKTTQDWGRHDWESGQIPDTYYTQCQHYMAVTGYPVWHLAVLVMGRGFWHYEVPRSDEDIAALTTAEETFWREHIEAGVQPEPDGSDRDAALLRRLNPDLAGSIELPGMDEQLDRLAEIDAISKRLRKEADAIKQGIQQRMAGAAEARTERYSVKISDVRSTRLDTTRIRKEAPEVYERYSKESVSRRFTYKEAKNG